MATDRDRAWVGSMAEVYDRCLGPALFRPFAVEVARRCAALTPRRVLEVAAGTGVVTGELAIAVPAADLTATDLNPAMVRHGAGATPQARWAVADAQRLPFSGGRFDLLTSSFGVMFFPDRPRAFAQAHRVLEPGGRLLFTTWDAVERHGFARALMVGLQRAFPDDPPPFVERIPHGYHDLDRVAADVRAGGFDAVDVETVTLTGHAGSAADIAIGFCTGTPLRAQIVGRGADPAATAALVEQVVAAEMGSGPIAAEMTAHVVTAR